jgi:hypothetical protein
VYQVHILILYFFKIRFNIILPSTYAPPKWSVPLISGCTFMRTPYAWYSLSVPQYLSGTRDDPSKGWSWTLSLWPAGMNLIMPQSRPRLLLLIHTSWKRWQRVIGGDVLFYGCASGLRTRPEGTLRPALSVVFNSRFWVTHYSSWQLFSALCWAKSVPSYRGANSVVTYFLLRNSGLGVVVFFLIRNPTCENIVTCRFVWVWDFCPSR